MKTATILVAFKKGLDLFKKVMEISLDGNVTVSEKHLLGNMWASLCSWLAAVKIDQMY